MAHGYLGARGLWLLGRLVQEGGSAHTPSPTVAARDPIYQDLNQVHPDKAESTF